MKYIRLHNYKLNEDFIDSYDNDEEDDSISNIAKKLADKNFIFKKLRTVLIDAIDKAIDSLQKNYSFSEWSESAKTALLYNPTPSKDLKDLYKELPAILNSSALNLTLSNNDLNSLITYADPSRINVVRGSSSFCSYSLGVYFLIYLSLFKVILSDDYLFEIHENEKNSYIPEDVYSILRYCTDNLYLMTSNNNIRGSVYDFINETIQRFEDSDFLNTNEAKRLSDDPAYYITMLYLKMMYPGQGSKPNHISSAPMLKDKGTVNYADIPDIIKDAEYKGSFSRSDLSEIDSTLRTLMLTNRSKNSSIERYGLSRFEELFYGLSKACENMPDRIINHPTLGQCILYNFNNDGGEVFKKYTSQSLQAKSGLPYDALVNPENKNRTNDSTSFSELKGDLMTGGMMCALCSLYPHMRYFDFAKMRYFARLRAIKKNQEEGIGVNKEATRSDFATHCAYENEIIYQQSQKLKSTDPRVSYAETEVKPIAFAVFDSIIYSKSKKAFYLYNSYRHMCVLDYIDQLNILKDIVHEFNSSITETYNKVKSTDDSSFKPHVDPNEAHNYDPYLPF